MISHYNSVVACAFIAYMTICATYLLIFIGGVAYKTIKKFKGKNKHE